MKKFIAIIAITMMLSSVAYAGNALTSTSVNNNYLGIGNPGEVQRSEAEINSHLQPMNTPLAINPDYSGPVFKDHKVQTEILDYLLKAEGLKPFTIVDVKRGYFEKKSAKSASTLLARKDYEEQKKFYVFRDENDLKQIKKYETVGYIDTYSKGTATLMDCFNQAIFDAGEMGGNILLLLKDDFMAGMEASTIGLGGSGAEGLLHGGNAASVYGFAIGYAKSKATPQTNPYFHGMVLFSEELIR